MSKSIRDAAIESGSEFQCDEWPRRLAQTVKKDGVQDCGRISEWAHFDLNTGLLEQFHAPGGDGVRIPHGNNHAVHA